jgi:hypothetical protein
MATGLFNCAFFANDPSPENPLVEFPATVVSNRDWAFETGINRKAATIMQSTRLNLTNNFNVIKYFIGILKNKRWVL